MTRKQIVRISLLCALGLGASATAASAQVSRLYFAGYLGLNSINDVSFSHSSPDTAGNLKFSKGTSFAGALGVRLTRNLRLEGEYSYTKSDLSSMNIAGVTGDAGGEFARKAVFANLYYDFDLPWRIQPFVGGGLGYGWHSGEIVDGSSSLTSASASDSALMWNVGAGIKYRPRDDMAFTAGYRFVDSMDLDFGNYKTEYDAHEFRLGLEWDLPVGGR